MSPTSKKLSGKRIYTCPTCNRDFNQCGNVVEHMRTHTGEKPFTCTICDKAFSSKSNINAHMLVHQTERNVVCKICGFAFKNNRALNRHNRHHVNDRRWICQYCGKAFYENCQLNAHLRVHTGERPYNCKHCHKSFRERSAWIRHTDIHLGRVIHQCHICGKGFSRKDNYVNHLKMHQNEKEGKGTGKKILTKAKDQKTPSSSNVQQVVENEIVLQGNETVAIRLEGSEAFAVSEGDKVQRIFFVLEDSSYLNGNDYIQAGAVVTTPNVSTIHNCGGDQTIIATSTGTRIENL